MNSKGFSLLLALSLVLAYCLNAGEISGRITDEKTGELLQGAHILLEGTSLGATTDLQGFYRISEAPSGNYVISASFLGYRVEKEKIQVSDQPLVHNFDLVPTVLSGQEVIYSTTRAVEGEAPISFTDVSGQKLRENYWAQDIPPLLSTIPGVYSYSESGLDVGYTHLNIRGFNPTRIGVTINNIPHNDPEDGAVYWVDMPDLAANIADIQLQRGVGYSANGTSTFGGSVNVVTMTPSMREPGVEANFGAGNYNTRKWGVALNSGLVNNTYGFYSRFSRIQTDGYRDNSKSALWSYFLTGVRYGERSITKVNVYGGPEVTHAAWDPSLQSDIARNRRHNPYTYSNTIDNFNQPHYELHHEYALTDDIQLQNSMFYIRGEGYNEKFKEDKDLIEFGFTPFPDVSGETIEKADFIYQKWVQKDHLGWIPSVTLKHEQGTLQAGGDLQWYQSDHYGYVIWGSRLPDWAPPQHRYYQYKGDVKWGGAFIRDQYQATDKLRVTADLELRLRRFDFKQEPMANFQADSLNRFSVDYLFFNPKIGVNYQLDPRISLFASAGISHRAPTDDEYWNGWDGPDDLNVDPLFDTPDTVRENGQIKYIEWSDPLIDPEEVVDLEIGANYRDRDLYTKLNFYWMNFRNEIIPDGRINEEDEIMKTNADHSIHAGIEWEAGYQPKQGPLGWANLTLSSNKLKSYTAYILDENWAPVKQDYSNHTIALFPSLIAQCGAGWRMNGLLGMFDFRYVGKQYLDNSQDEERTIDPYTLLGFTLSYQLPKNLSIVNWEVKLRVNNLLNEAYETSGSMGYNADWALENAYFVGAERNYFVTLIGRI